MKKNAVFFLVVLSVICFAQPVGATTASCQAWLGDWIFTYTDHGAQSVRFTSVCDKGDACMASYFNCMAYGTRLSDGQPVTIVDLIFGHPPYNAEDLVSYYELVSPGPTDNSTVVTSPVAPLYNYFSRDAYIDGSFLNVFLLVSGLKVQGPLDFTYTVSVSDNVTITGYTGSGGAVVIPSTLEGLSVVSIGATAFESQTGITAITIPASVTSIGTGAFYGCTSLASAYFYGNAPAMGDVVFDGCASGFTVYYLATKTGFTNPWYGYPTAVFTPPSTTTTSIAPTTTTTMKPTTSTTVRPGGDFTYTVSNGTVTITGYIGSGGTVVIPDTIDGMPVVAIMGSGAGHPSYYGAFEGCTGLTSITIPSTVTIIGYNAFNSTGLTSVTIPNSVTSIGGYAFHDCSSLTSVSIGSGVSSIGDEAFYDCNNLTSLNVAPGNPVYTSQDGVLYNKVMTKLIQYPSGKSGAFIIPNGVTSIGDIAFYNCTRLPSVTIPSSVTSMYGYLQTGTNWCQYPMPSCWTYQSINDGSFFYCDNLSSVYFEGNAPNIVYDGNCSSLAPESFCDIFGPFIRLAIGFTVYYNANCGTGFTNPWYGYPTAIFTAPCTTTSTTTSTTTTTTIPAETCTVELFPRRLSKVMNTVSQLQVIVIWGNETASFSKATTIDWGTSTVETMLKAALGRRLIIALVLVNGNNQKVGDTYEVTAGDCTGQLPVKMF